MNVIPDTSVLILISAGGLIVPDRITRSVVSVSALTWFI
jgi:hypothetical protein